MTKKTLSIFAALDRSGSMSGEKWTNAIASFNDYVKGLQDEKIEGEITLVAFDSINVPNAVNAQGQTFQSYKSNEKIRLENIVTAQSIAYFTPIDSNVLSPSGMTPLYDAAAHVMDLALANNADRTVVVIMTDGMENTSKEYTAATIKNKVKILTLLKWEVIFLGANFDVAQYTASAGLEMTKMRNFDLNDLNQRKGMTASFVMNSSTYATTGAAMDMTLDAK